MSRSPINVSLDRDLLVILLYQASFNHRSVNEELEELLYAAVRAEAEADPQDATLSHLDDIYGKIHGHWESEKPRDNVIDRVPY